jgi:hypothetical protein
MKLACDRVRFAGPTSRLDTLPVDLNRGAQPPGGVRQ